MAEEQIREQIREQRTAEYDPRDQSKERGLATAAGAGAVFGPVGALLGAGVYMLSRSLHKGELESAIAAETHRYDADIRQASGIAQGFEADMAFDAELYDDPRLTDIDRRQHAMIKNRMERAASGLEHFDPAVRAQAIRDMNIAAEQREVWLEDIESRAETMGDMETQRAWKVQDDLLTHQRQLYSQSLQFEQQFKLQNEKERINTERSLLMDNINTVKDAYRGKSLAIRGSDALLATIQRESVEVDGRRVLTWAGRSAVENSIVQQITTGPLSGILQATGALTGGIAGIAGGLPGMGAGALVGKQLGAEVAKFLSGEKMTDAELISLAEALDLAGEENFDNIIANAQPVIKKQAELAGADPDIATAGVTFELTDRQKEWRAQYRQDWDTNRNRFTRPNSGEDGSGVPAEAPRRSGSTGAEFADDDFGRGREHMNRKGGRLTN